MSRTAADVQAGAVIGAQYRAIGENLRRSNMPLTARRIFRAAIAEEVDPEPKETPPCRICGRLRSCLAVS